MPTPVYISGWEHGVLDTGGGAMLVADWSNASISSSIFRTGTRSLRLNPSAAVAYWEKAALGGTTTVIVTRFYVYFSVLPNADTFIFNDDTAFTQAGIAFDQSEAKFATMLDGALAAAGGPTITTGTWYRLDLRIASSGGTTSAEAEVDGMTLATSSGSFTDGTFNAYKIGPNSQTRTMDMHADDFIVSHTAGDYPIGEGLVLALSPNAVGTHNLEASPSSAFLTDIGGSESGIAISDTTSWQQIDDVPLSADDDHIVLENDASLTAAHYAEWLYADSTETGEIQGVQAIVVIRQDAAANCDITAKLRESGSEANIYTGDINGTGRDYRVTCFATKPSGGAWTDAALDDARLRFGYTTDADGRIRLDSSMLEVAYGVSVVPPGRRYKRLYGPATLPTSPTTLYTVP